MRARTTNADSVSLSTGATAMLALALALTLLLFAGNAHAAKARWHDVADIRARAEAASGNPQASAQVDDRIRMLACSGPLDAQRQNPNSRSNRITVKVGCSQPTWSLYVPVKVNRQQTVVTLTRSLGRGDVISADDLATQARPGSGGYAYISDPALVVGKRLTRPAPSGTPLTPAWIDAPIMIERGQQVILMAAAGGLKIRTRGEALADGSVKDRIRVRNLSSGRIVEAVVRSADTVEVIF